jgi:hypothetical protein
VAKLELCKLDMAAADHKNGSRNGRTNSGGGGGSLANATNSGDSGGGTGGSGIVVIRYADTFADAISTTGSPTFTNTGGFKIYTFTGSGTIVF